MLKRKWLLHSLNLWGRTLTQGRPAGMGLASLQRAGESNVKQKVFASFSSQYLFPQEEEK
jgi:hypothetical protein